MVSASSNVTDTGLNASWYVVPDPVPDPNPDTTTGYIAYSFNLQELGFTDVGDHWLAFHWTMSCGNDVIEGVFDYKVEDEPDPPGSSHVAEPASLALLGLGMAGVIGVRRRRRS